MMSDPVTMEMVATWGGLNVPVQAEHEGDDNETS